MLYTETGKSEIRIRIFVFQNHNCFAMKTFRCRKCLRKTLEIFEAVDDLQQGMVLAISLCKAQGGDGTHDWSEIEGKIVSFLQLGCFVLSFLVYFLSIPMLLIEFLWCFRWRRDHGATNFTSPTTHPRPRGHWSTVGSFIVCGGRQAERSRFLVALCISVSSQSPLVDVSFPARNIDVDPAGGGGNVQVAYRDAIWINRVYGSSWVS